MVSELDPAFAEDAAGESFLVIADPDDLFEVEVATIRRAIAEGFHVIYILTIHPYIRAARSIPGTSTPDNTLIIDCISREASFAEMELDDVTYLDSPAELDAILHHIAAAVRSFDQKPAVVILDSIRGIVGYNAEDDVEDFLRVLTERTETYGNRFHLFAADTALPDYRDEIADLFDDTITVTEPMTPIVSAEDGGLDIHLPTPISRRLDWESGDRLAADIIDDHTIKLTAEEET